MNRHKDIDQHNDEVAEMFSDLPPFTITINNGHDAAFLSSAMLAWMAGGDHELGEKALLLMINASLKLGVEEGVSLFFEEGDKIGNKYPKCMKSLFIHMVGHALKKHENGQE